VQKMTAAEYLTARGWIQYVPPLARRAAKDSDSWWDPLHYGQVQTGDGEMWGCLRSNSAIAIQRARDAAEERAAWVQFTAGQGTQADNYLNDYRDKFAVEIVVEEVQT